MVEIVPCQGQGKSSRVSIYLSAEVECVSRAGKTARAGGYKGEFVVVEYAGAVDLANIDATTNTNKANGARLTSRL